MDGAPVEQINQLISSYVSTNNYYSQWTVVAFYRIPEEQGIPATLSRCPRIVNRSVNAGEIVRA